MNNAISPKDASQVAHSRYLHKRTLFVLTLLLVLAMPLLQRWFGISGAKSDWSFTQLWYSIRENYFFENPMLYLFQGEHMAQSMDWPVYLFLLAVTIIFTFGILKILFRITRLYYGYIHPGGLTSSMSVLISNVINAKNDVLEPMPGETSYATYTLNHGTREYTFAIRGSTVILTTHLQKSLPHLLLDAKARTTSPARFLPPEDEYVINGVMYEHFRVFTTEKSPVHILKFFTPLLCDALVRYGSFADMQIQGNEFALVIDTKTLATHQNPEKLFEGINAIATQLEHADTSNYHTKPLSKVRSTVFLDRLLFRQLNPLPRIAWLLFGLLSAAVFLPRGGFQESTSMALATLLGVIVALLTLRQTIRRIV